MKEMKNTYLYVGLGLLAISGIGFCMWRKKQGEVSETEKSNAIGRRTIGVSRGNLGGGIVNIADPSKLCCCAGTTDSKGWCNNPSTRCCPDIAGDKQLPTSLAFSGLGSFGSIGLGTNILNQANCTSDQIQCTRRGVASCCNKPKPISTTTASGFNGNGYYRQPYGSVLMVDPTNY